MKNARSPHRQLRALLQACLLALALALFYAPLVQAQENKSAEVRQLQVLQTADGLTLNANTQFKLGAALQDALAKGVPLHFVAEADIRRDRWYWYDEKIRVAKRSMRLSYAPLARRWRVAVQTGTASDSVGVNLNMNFNTQDEALAAIRNIGDWRIADNSLLDADERYNINYRFYLDLSQLPRPFQIGINAQSDWNIDVSANARPIKTPTIEKQG